MAYEKTVWANGDIISAEKMNKIEQGIEDAHSSGGSGSDSLIVTFTYSGYSNSWTCDSTNQDIYTAYTNGKSIKFNIVDDSDSPVLNDYGTIYNITETSAETGMFSFIHYEYRYLTLTNDEIIDTIINPPSYNFLATASGTTHVSYSISSGSNQYLINCLENNDGTISDISLLALYPLKVFYSSQYSLYYTPIASTPTSVYYKGPQHQGYGIGEETALYNEIVLKLTYDSGVFQLSEVNTTSE